MLQFVLVRLADGQAVHLVERVRYPSGARWVVRRRWLSPHGGALH